MPIAHHLFSLYVFWVHKDIVWKHPMHFSHMKICLKTTFTLCACIVTSCIAGILHINLSYGFALCIQYGICWIVLSSQDFFKLNCLNFIVLMRFKKVNTSLTLNDWTLSQILVCSCSEDVSYLQAQPIRLQCRAMSWRLLTCLPPQKPSLCECSTTSTPQILWFNQKKHN